MAAITKAIPTTLDMANISRAGMATVWGDLADTTEPMRANWFLVKINLPTSIKLTGTGFNGNTLSVLVSGVTLPEETVMTEEIATKLSTYDIVVGKERGSFSIKFKEQIGSPVTTLLSAWHSAIVDARGAGVNYRNNYIADIFVAPLTGTGVPFYWWMLSGCFPKKRGNPTDFGEDQKNAVYIDTEFSYLELFDAPQTVANDWKRTLADLTI